MLSSFARKAYRLFVGSCFGCFCFLPTLQGQSGLYINEFMASNQGFLYDEDGADVDWIELYNASSVPVSLLGYSLSDKANTLNRWLLPDTLIGPGEFMVIFASGKDRRVPGQPLHTNFSIAAAGEPLYLSYHGTVQHALGARNLAANQSAGLIPDGSTTYLRMSTPSPGYSNTGASIAELITFSQPGGFYEDAFFLYLLPSNPNFQIRYTLNGSQPTAASSAYNGPLLLNESLRHRSDFHKITLGPAPHFQPENTRQCIVVRAALFDADGQQSSRIFTHSYLMGSLGNRHALPVISISADSLALFSYDSGLFVPGKHFDPDWRDLTGNYHQRGADWERNCHVEYMENGHSRINQAAGLRVHGGLTRREAQKPMRLYARKSYGPAKFDHKFFPDKSMDRYDKLVLKPFRAAWNQAGFLDHWTNQAALGLNFEYPASHAVVVYLNGTYWGIYYLQERIDDHFIAENFPQLDPDSVEVVARWWGEGTKGISYDFLALINFVLGHDLTDAAHYQRVANWMDIDNFIDYQLFQIFIANRDWPDNNIKCWREMKPGAKWRWIFHDGDGAIKVANHKSIANAMSIAAEGPGNVRSTALFRALLRNQDFRAAFLARADALFMHAFTPEIGYVRTNRVAGEVASEVTNNIDRFGWPGNMESWFQEVDNTLDFAANRSCYLAKEMAAIFGHQVPLKQACQVPEVPVMITQLYPNPNAGAFSLAFTSATNSRCKLEIYDLSGRCLYRAYVFAQEGNNQVAVDLELNHGIYLLQLSTHYHTSAQKLVIHP